MATGFPDWLRAMALMGETATGYKIIAVTDEGELYALLQGMTPEDELQTIRLDDEGRISAFIIDSADAWNRMLSIGNAELAVRMGSAIAYDRRGQVIFFDDFEHGWGLWTGTSEGTGANVELDPTSSLSGGYSLKMIGGSAIRLDTSVDMSRGQSPVGRIGLEVAFSITDIVGYLVFDLFIYDGSRQYTAAVRYDYATEDLSVYPDGGPWTWVADAKFVDPDPTHYNVLKFVIDTDTKTYVRLLANAVEVDLSGRSYHDEDDTTKNEIGVRFYVMSRALNNDTINIDDVIVTLAEP